MVGGICNDGTRLNDLYLQELMKRVFRGDYTTKVVGYLTPSTPKFYKYSAAGYVL